MDGPDPGLQVHVTGHMLLNGGHGLAPPSECEEGEHAEGPVAKVQGGGASGSLGGSEGS